MSFFSRRKTASLHYNAISQSHALIWFAPDGTIRGANENFCKALGYKLAEIVGKHHRIFVEKEALALPAYEQFWRDLAQGKGQQGQFRRISKAGEDVWIEASYDPVIKGGKVTEVVKIATDITATKIAALHNANKLRALDQSLAVIEFELDGTVLDANENFCKTMGYRLDEIVGKKHAMFCDSQYVASAEYQSHWERLRRGEFLQDNYIRQGKGGAKVWIQASYNPVFNSRGNAYRVVKFATDVTERMKSVDVISHAIEQLADGNLTAPITSTLDNSVAQTGRDFNSAIAKLDRTVAEIAGASDDITNTANEMLSSAHTIAKRTEQQAAALEQTAAALEQITQTVHDTSKRAAEAGDLVRETRSSALASGAIVTSAVQAMDRIENSSKAISNIISVIDEIAFQTNLLALNAGVEAARAGEAGKGFAVVAQEVRELAQRSANAAKEIKSLISSSSTEVRTGVDLVAQTGEALTKIVEKVLDIDKNVAAIVEASREQSVGVKEIGQAVNQLDQGTQQNAATVEEQSAASMILAEKAEVLNGLLGQFKTSRQTHRPTSTNGYDRSDRKVAYR
jgi:methyl-accepting chemotaxis protein